MPIFFFSGGHPHNWNAISKECLSLLLDLTQRLVAYHDTVATNGRAKSLSTGSERKSSSEASGTSNSTKSNRLRNKSNPSLKYLALFISQQLCLLYILLYISYRD